MRKLLFAAAAVAALVAAAPASAQVYYDEPGAGVQIGPFGFGVGPRYGWRDRAYHAYGADCPLVRERILTASGRVIFRTHRVCE